MSTTSWGDVDPWEYTIEEHVASIQHFRMLELEDHPIYYKCKACNGEGFNYRGEHHEHLEKFLCDVCEGTSFYSWIDAIRVDFELIEVNNDTKTS